jgi:uncharacterized protein YciI
MSLFAIEGMDAPDKASARAAHTDAHVARLLALGERFVIGGPFLSPDDRSIGSLVVIEADSLEAAEAFAAADPFVLNGVYQSVTVRRWAFGHLRASGRG